LLFKVRNSRVRCSFEICDSVAYTEPNLVWICRYVQFDQADFDESTIFSVIMIITSFLSCCTSKNKGKLVIFACFHRKMDFEVDLGNRRIEKVKECLAWWTLFFTYRFHRFSQKVEIWSFSRATVMFCQKCLIFSFTIVHFGIQALFCLYLVSVKRLRS